MAGHRCRETVTKKLAVGQLAGLYNGKLPQTSMSPWVRVGLRCGFVAVDLVASLIFFCLLLEALFTASSGSRVEVSSFGVALVRTLVRLRLGLGVLLLALVEQLVQVFAC